MEAWNRLRDLFQDNKHSRVVTLEYDFSHVKMENFPNASAYCQQLKILADQLKNVGSPVSDSRLVLQLVSGLTQAYRGVGTLIRQSNPLPSFYQARSILTLEEAGMAKEAAMGSESAMIATGDSDMDYYSTSGHSGQPKGKNSNDRKNSGGRKNIGKGNRNHTGGGYSGRGGCKNPIFLELNFII
ncbi:hypothetical protein CASFOL_034167 [Castilleja foliolosa]|uniref:Uncharacterized protein n=1 Tax=Castilleja foliolosa TaxID=1961234 RepID=A0ABD3BYF1_9LAMI